MKLLRVCVLSLFVFTSATFAQRGGGHGGGGGSRGGGGGGFRSGGGGGGYRGGGGFTSGGGYRGGSGFTSGSGYRGGGGLRSGIGAGFSRGGYGYSRGFAGYGRGYGYGSGYRGYGYRGYGYSSFGFGFSYPFYSGYGGYYDYYPYSYYPYGYDGYTYASYAYPQVAYAAPEPVYYDQGSTVAPPPRQGQNREQPYKETIYLIAFSDHRIQACLAYWVEGDTLHYVTREHEHKQISLDGIDRAFSEQLNRDRRVEFRLPR